MAMGQRLSSDRLADGNKESGINVDVDTGEY